MSSIILEARDVKYRYPRGMEALRGISFHIRRGEKIALVGPNGAGKSTLLAMFNGMIRPDSGTLLYDNRPVRYEKGPLRELRRRVGFVFQNPDRQIIAPTVFQDVAFGPVNLGSGDDEIRETVTTALRHVGLEGFERRPTYQLSGGEKKRVAIAGVLAMDPEVLVFDEPTSGLDPSGSEDIMELLDELNHEGKTIIISTHDVELAYPWANRAILLLNGRILQEDVPEIAFGNPDLIRQAHLSLPILLELHIELQKRGLPLPDTKPRGVLDMLQVLENLFLSKQRAGKTGTILVGDVESDQNTTGAAFFRPGTGIAVGAMGTRAKQYAQCNQIALDFSYGVIDKCILRSLLGEDSLILTVTSMVPRVHDRVAAYEKESGIPIMVKNLKNNRIPEREP